VKWKSHAAITRAVCRAVGLSEYHERIVIDGAIEPDRHPVKARKGSGASKRVAHHGRSDRAIYILIWKARLAFVQGDEEHGCRNLGRALHYVQDKCVSFGWSKTSHDILEEEIGAINIPRNAIEEGIDHSICSPVFVSECVRSIHPKDDACSAMYEATLISAALAMAVIDGTDATGLGHELKRAENVHRFVVMPLVGTALILIAGAAIMIGDLVILLVAPPVIAVAAMSMRKYAAARNIASWYGLD